MPNSAAAFVVDRAAKCWQRGALSPGMTEGDRSRAVGALVMVSWVVKVFGRPPGTGWFRIDLLGRLGDVGAVDVWNENASQVILVGRRASVIMTVESDHNADVDHVLDGLYRCRISPPMTFS